MRLKGAEIIVIANCRADRFVSLLFHSRSTHRRQTLLSAVNLADKGD
jgi:hypothetical protein